MKKTVIFAATFLAVFGLVAGLTVFSAAPVTAGELCGGEYNCIYEIYCANETGPECPNPTFPYYRYAINGWCTSGNPHHFCPDYQGGCCRFFW
ncbi:MAG: hypothetical protein GY841_08470 [FCB group bacterium]|nr:hypothetical protein [FCB group bacterium]